MPRGVRNEDFSEREKMRIAEVYRDAPNAKLRAAKHYVRTVLDGNVHPNPRRDLLRSMNKSTLANWVNKMEQGIAPHDDRRR